MCIREGIGLRICLPHFFFIFFFVLVLKSCNFAAINAYHSPPQRNWASPLLLQSALYCVVSWGACVVLVATTTTTDIKLAMRAVCVCALSRVAATFRRVSKVQSNIPTYLHIHHCTPLLPVFVFNLIFFLVACSSLLFRKQIFINDCNYI